MGRLARRFSERQGDDALPYLWPERRDARGTGLVTQEPVHAVAGKALLPAPDGGLALAGHTHDRVRAQPVGSSQHDGGAPDVLLRAVAIRDHSFKPGAVRGGNRDDDPWRIAQTRTPTGPAESLSGLFRQPQSTRCLHRD